MAEEGWVVLEVRYCPRCQLDYPPGQESCPRCGQALVEKSVRVPAEEL